jgi:tRNA-dihydrouridine synthase A
MHPIQTQHTSDYLTPQLNHRFCVAPMLDWTDRHERMFLRMLSRYALLYTEMITSAALVHGGKIRLLQFSALEHPVAVQLGGSNPEELRRATAMAVTQGYDEINLNVGCPSDRVQSGRFGACLMDSPQLVAECVRSMQAESPVPVTVKCRIGIDDRDSDSYFENFVSTVAEAGCRTFIVHARVALLKGLSPKENREIPPLNYDRVMRLKNKYPHLEIILNGGISSLSAAHSLLEHVDGVMLGREVYQNPYVMATVDRDFFDAAASVRSRQQIMADYLPYIETELAAGAPLQCMTRHILGIFKGQRGGKQFRRHLSENACLKNAGINVLLDAMAYIGEELDMEAQSEEVCS